MAFGDRFKNFFGWGDDDTVYEDESSFDDDIWADMGIDPNSDPDTWTDPITPTQEDDPYGIGSLFDFDPASNVFDPDPTPNIFDDDWADTYDLGDWGAPPVDFEDPDFNWGEFDADSYLDDLLDPKKRTNYGWDTDPETGLSFNTGYFDDPDWLSKGFDDDEFNNFLRDFDFDDPKADWAGGINSLRGWETDPETGMSMNVGSILGDPTSGFQTSRDYLDYLNKDWSTGGGAGKTAAAKTPAASGIFSGKRMPKLAGFLNRILGGANTAIDTVGGGIGGLLNSTLGQLAMLNYMKNKNKDIMDIPVGWGDGGGGGGDGSPIDYRVFNLQPALMPGVAYANVAPPVPPPEMRGGGLGDVTLAKLEPGEFVVTKKAVDNIGAQNLYRMMKQAEGRG